MKERETQAEKGIRDEEEEQGERRGRGSGEEREPQ